ncbi:hypothetical protein [Bacteroides xylanisolvens]|uniref:hypothetical protein n=1 Tax=Bacteroides xylanisolvens TaxID=371601 RepID=UPI00397755DE
MNPINHRMARGSRVGNLLHAPGHIQCNFFDLIRQLRGSFVSTAIYHRFSALNYSNNRTFPTSLISIY